MIRSPFDGCAGYRIRRAMGCTDGVRRKQTQPVPWGVNAAPSPYAMRRVMRLGSLSLAKLAS